MLFGCVEDEEMVPKPVYTFNNLNNNVLWVCVYLVL